MTTTRASYTTKGEPQKAGQSGLNHLDSSGEHSFCLAVQDALSNFGQDDPINKILTNKCTDLRFIKARMFEFQGLTEASGRKNQISVCLTTNNARQIAAF